MYILTY